MRSIQKREFREIHKTIATILAGWDVSEFPDERLGGGELVVVLMAVVVVLGKYMQLKSNKVAQGASTMGILVHTRGLADIIHTRELKAIA